MTRLARRAGAALVLVAIGRLLSPTAVPVYDGLGQPDEPYRYVSPPPGAPRTAEPTGGQDSLLVVAGKTAQGLALTSAEAGPQVSLYLPPRALATSGTKVEVRATPMAPTEPPKGARFDGNAYEITFSSTGPVTMTPQAALATLSMRATTARQPGPVFEHRTGPGARWTPLPTTRAGLDVYYAAFHAPGQYALAFVEGGHRKGASTTPYLLLGGVVLLVAVVVVVRLRAAG